jgi:hypothetical protein
MRFYIYIFLLFRVTNRRGTCLGLAKRVYIYTHTSDATYCVNDFGGNVNEWDTAPELHVCF